VHDAEPVQIVQCRCHLDRERRGLLRLEWAEPPDQRGQPWPLDELEHDVRTFVARSIAKQAGNRRVVQRRQDLGLAAKPAQGAFVVDAIGTQHLGDRDVMQLLVEGEERLVAGAAAEQLQRGEPRDDLVALLQIPAVAPFLRRDRHRLSSRGGDPEPHGPVPAGTRQRVSCRDPSLV
jgi:hypothetical protein